MGRLIGKFLIMALAMSSIEMPLWASETDHQITFSKNRVESGENLISYITFSPKLNPSEIKISLISPSNLVTQFETPYFRDSESTTNLWLNVLTIASDAESGTWGSLLTYLDSNLQRVNVIGPNLEIENPTTVKANIRDVSLSGNYFSPGDPLTATVSATTYKGVRTVNLILESPNSQTFTFDRPMKKVKGTNFIGTWQITVSLPDTPDSVGNWSGRITMEDVYGTFTSTDIPAFKVETSADVKSREDAAEAIKKSREQAEANAIADYEAKLVEQNEIIEEAKRKLSSSTRLVEAAEKAAAAAREKLQLVEVEAAKKLAEINARPTQAQTTVTLEKTAQIRCKRGKVRVLVIDIKPKCPKGFKKVKK